MALVVAPLLFFLVAADHAVLGLRIRSGAPSQDADGGLGRSAAAGVLDDKGGMSGRCAGLCATRWYEELPRNPRKVFSQNDEDGILEHIFAHINTTNKHYVEFGTENGDETNTRLLRERYGWTGLMMDVGFEDPTIGLHREEITPENIVGLFQKYGVEKEIDLLSVDVDSYDVHVLRSILDHGFRPRVLVVELNGNYARPEDDVSFLTYPNRKVETWGWDDWCGMTCFDGSRKMLCGAGPAAMNHVAGKAGYHALYLNDVNMFFLRGDLASPLMKAEWTFARVLDHATKQAKPRTSVFSREECGRFMDGMVDVRYG